MKGTGARNSLKPFLVCWLHDFGPTSDPMLVSWRGEEGIPMFHDKSDPVDVRISLAFLGTVLFFISSAKPWASRSLNVIRTQVQKELHPRNALCVFEIAKNNWKRQSPPLRGHKMPPRRKMCDPNVVKSQIFSNVDQLRVQGRRFQI